IFVAAVLGLAHLARVGTPAARWAAAGAFALVVAGAILRRVLVSRALADSRRIVRAAVVPADGELGERTLRALDLVEDVERDPHLGSAELARLHLDRQLARVLPELVVAGSARRARAWRATGYATAAAAIAA